MEIFFGNTVCLCNMGSINTYSIAIIRSLLYFTSDVSVGSPFGCRHGFSAVFYMWLIRKLLMRCREVQQFTGGNKTKYNLKTTTTTKNRYCTFSREVDRQCEGNSADAIILLLFCRCYNFAFIRTFHCTALRAVWNWTNHLWQVLNIIITFWLWKKYQSFNK